MEDKKPSQELKIVVGEDQAEGRYVNFLSVLHNQAEFVMDFGRMVPGRPEVHVLSRLISNPLAFKQVVLTMQENLQRYEAHFGAIPLQPPTPFENEGSLEQ